MMENDPDYGYYCETGEDNVTPVKIMHNNLTEMYSMNLHRVLLTRPILA